MLRGRSVHLRVLHGASSSRRSQVSPLSRGKKLTLSVTWWGSHGYSQFEDLSWHLLPLHLGRLLTKGMLKLMSRSFAMRRSLSHSARVCTSDYRALIAIISALALIWRKVNFHMYPVSLWLHLNKISLIFYCYLLLILNNIAFGRWSALHRLKTLFYIVLNYREWDSTLKSFLI